MRYGIHNNNEIVDKDENSVNWLQVNNRYSNSCNQYMCQMHWNHANSNSYSSDASAKFLHKISSIFPRSYHRPLPLLWRSKWLDWQWLYFSFRLGIDGSSTSDCTVQVTAKLQMRQQRHFHSMRRLWLWQRSRWSLWVSASHGSDKVAPDGMKWLLLSVPNAHYITSLAEPCHEEQPADIMLTWNTIILYSRLRSVGLCSHNIWSNTFPNFPFLSFLIFYLCVSSITNTNDKHYRQ